MPSSRVLDAPADGLTVDATLQIAEAYELVIIHTSTPSFPRDALFAEKLKEHKPSLLIGMVRAKVAVDPFNSLLSSDAIDFVCREEFDFTCFEVSEGKPFAQILGLSYRLPDGSIEHNEARPILEDMDALPFVAPVYKRDLKIDNYFIGYLSHPYVSIYTGRGCRSRCTFCLCGPRPWEVTALPDSFSRERAGKVDQRQHARGEGNHVGRRHLHRLQATRGRDCAGAGQARRHVIMQREG